MFVRGRRLALAALFALVALVGSGCAGGGSKPVALPSLSSSATPSPTPSATSTAAELDAVSAVVRRYFALIDGPTTDAAAAELLRMTTPVCKCRRVASSIRDVARKDEKYFGGSMITGFVPNIDGVAAADVLVQYDYKNGGIKDSSGKVITSSRGHKNVKVDFRLLKTDGVWLIDIIEALSDGTPV